MSVHLGVSSFTRKQVQTLWTEGLEKERSNNIGLASTCGLKLREEVLLANTDDERQDHIHAVLSDLIGSVKKNNYSYQELDDVSSQELDVWFGEDFSTIHRSSPVEDRSISLLVQLPTTPPRLDLGYDLWHSLPGSFYLKKFCSSASSMELDDQGRVKAAPWQELETVSKFSTSTIRLGILVATCQGNRLDIASMTHRFLNYVAELIDTLCTKTTRKERPESDYGIAVVKSYLWALWTRCLLLFYWYILRHKMHAGYDEEWAGLLALRGTDLFMSPDTRAMLQVQADSKAPYMCSWAFELLKISRASVGQDFRYFHECYARVHGQKAARCLWQSSLPCNGSHPLECGRFKDKRLVAEEQSVHVCHDRKCKRMVWNRQSYLSVEGPVAVGFKPRIWASHKVEYTKATDRTMAISHVWSHGHGGRPGTGINACLHQKFSRIAKSQGCHSYWMDTLCIPEEHELRKQAILYINMIFSTSRAVLVLDKDLMSIDISKPSIEVLESLLATFLVCDWNVRAWTMLEAVRGCRNLQLLCKDERVIALRDCLLPVHRQGRIDLSVLFIATQHLLPTSTSGESANIVQSLESAGSLLSYRHATRQGDEIVIWSLLSRTTTCFNAEAMWKGLVGRRIRTAFLMSYAPRLGHLRGFSWAPETPYIRNSYAKHASQTLGELHVYDGADSAVARITSRGLEGAWFMYEVTREDDAKYKDSPVAADGEDGVGRDEQGTGNHRIWNYGWKSAIDFLKVYKFVILIRPLSERRGSVYRHYSDRGDPSVNRYAICCSNDERNWQWKSVETWPQNVPFPAMEIEDLLIV